MAEKLPRWPITRPRGAELRRSASARDTHPSVLAHGAPRDRADSPIHLLRLVVGHDHRIVIPGSALLGGTLLVAADTAARTVLAPRQLPVGALTAMIGVPLFLILITRRRAFG